MAFSTLIITIMMFAAQGQSEKILTNEDVLELIEAGLSSDLIVTIIETSRSDFDTDLTTILVLTKAEVPDTVLQAMVKAAAAPKPYDPAADNQLLIYVSDSDSWSMSVSFAGGGRQWPGEQVEEYDLRRRRSSRLFVSVVLTSKQLWRRRKRTTSLFWITKEGKAG